MPQENLEPKTESLTIDGHVVMVGCIYHPDTQRWEPSASIKPTWSSAPAVRVTTTAEHFQDTPINAMDVAHKLATDWLSANKPSSPPDDGTVDAAV